MVHLQIICHIHKNFINRIDMNVIFRNILQINTIYFCRIVDIELHSRRCHNIFHVLRNLKYPASSRNSQCFHRRRYRQTNRLAGPLRIRNDQTGLHRIQSTLHALYRSIKRFQINTQVCPHPILHVLMPLFVHMFVFYIISEHKFVFKYYTCFKNCIILS